MVGFRSEAHLERWLAASGQTRGAVLGVVPARELAAAWFGGALDFDWRPRSRAESQAILEAHGLTGSFWRL